MLLLTKSLRTSKRNIWANKLNDRIAATVPLPSTPDFQLRSIIIRGKQTLVPIPIAHIITDKVYSCTRQLASGRNDIVARHSKRMRNPQSPTYAREISRARWLSALAAASQYGRAQVSPGRLKSPINRFRGRSLVAERRRSAAAYLAAF